jgi:hypothetical protein
MSARSIQLSYRNVLCAVGFAFMLVTTTPTGLAAGELVQFDATSTGGGPLTLLGYLARPRGPEPSP